MKATKGEKHDVFPSNISELFSMTLNTNPPLRQGDLVSNNITRIDNYPLSHMPNTDMSRPLQTSPNQLLWLKRFDKDYDLHADNSFQLKMVEPFRNLFDTEETLIDIATHLYLNLTKFGPLFGQKHIVDTGILENDTTNMSSYLSYLDVDQPLTEPHEITDEDIKQQEARVTYLRKLLAKLMQNVEELSQLS